MVITFQPFSKFIVHNRYPYPETFESCAFGQKGSLFKGLTFSLYHLYIDR